MGLATLLGLACLCLFPNAQHVKLMGSRIEILTDPHPCPHPIDLAGTCIVSACWPLTRSVWSGRWVPIHWAWWGRIGGSCRLREGSHSPVHTPQILAFRQARRPVPPEVVQQYQDILHRSQWQRAQLEQGGPAIRRGRGLGTGTQRRGLGTGTQGRHSGSGPILTLFHSQNTWPSWNVSYNSIQRLPGASAVKAAG